MAKFDGLDAAALPVRQLMADDVPDAAGFRPVRPEFATYWKRGRILREVKADVCQCWYVQHSAALGGYITLLADRFTADEALLAGEGIKYEGFPAIRIGLLAADERAKGAGKRLVMWALDYMVTVLAPSVGVRFATVDALFDPDTGYDTAGFYTKFGFARAREQFQPDKERPYRTMYLDLKPLLDTRRAFLESAG